jgi:hypothetical protein
MTFPPPPPRANAKSVIIMNDDKTKAETSAFFGARCIFSFLDIQSKLGKYALFRCTELDLYLSRRCFCVADQTYLLLLHNLGVRGFGSALMSVSGHGESPMSCYREQCLTKLAI